MNPQYRDNFNLVTGTYSEGQQIAVSPGCFAYMFTNIGDATALVNDMVIFPSATPATAIGDSRTISGHKSDLFRGFITLKFAFPIVGTNPLVEIVQLCYVDEYYQGEPKRDSI